MKYCSKCKRIYKDSGDKCECGQTLIDNVKLTEYDIIFLVKCSGFEKDRIEAALSDSSIPFQEIPDKKQLSTSVVTGLSNELFNIYVRYDDFNKAKDIAIGIGAIVPSEDEILEEEIIEQNKTEVTDMNDKSRFIWRIVSIILFLILIWGVVVGTDFIISSIKGMI